jgi:CRISPR-associated exonuclease Cas4
MTKLADETDRLRALTDLDATLLVEAAAGTGKTSLLAGRVVCLLAAGTPPRAIAAITFTEFAAGELRERITRYLDAVAAARVPEELRLAFPGGTTKVQIEAVRAARKRLDELTCTTIHGFCHALLRTYAVEAGIDPGAEIIDRANAELAFATLFERWLRDRLDGSRDRADPIVQTAENNPIRAESLLRKFAEFRRDHRTAKPVPAKIEIDAETAFADAVAGFRRWFNSVGGADGAEQDLADLEELARHFAGRFATRPDFDQMWKLAHPPQVTIMRKSATDLRQYRRMEVWCRAYGDEQGRALAEEAGRHYEACALEFRGLIGRLATAIVSIFSVELDELLERFRRFKRSAAVLDFDDLLYLARDVLRGQEAVRLAAAARFTRILVDEFQDTDPIQAEIIFLLTSAAGSQGRWNERALVPGRLFMVGDPKQAIYRFRGADVATYRLARVAIERQFPGNILRVASNFRSCADVLRHVNLCFRTPLERQESGYVALEATRGSAEHGMAGVAKIKVDVMPQARIEDIRDEEAQVVAETCSRLIGNLKIRRSGGDTRLLAAGDIALLAPTGRELWRYERALEEAGLPFSSQAGKNFYRRQEVQDLVALVRALADPRDTVALGALLRGPLVGLTEEELLDLAEALATRDDNNAQERLTLIGDPSAIPHPLARETVTILRDLRRQLRSAAPALLLAEAIERLKVRAILMTRSADQASRALANVDAFVEKARAYGVRGFRQFANDVNDEWSRHVSHDEGVVDADDHVIKIVTIHSSKGLEWPVVIPINGASNPRPPEQFVHRRSDDTLHWVLGDVVPPELSEAIASTAHEEAEERLRLLYVACTRAMDLLVLPALSWTGNASWARTIDLQLDQIAELDISALAKQPFGRPPEATNAQTLDQFEGEQRNVERAFARVRWIRPSDADPDLVTFERPAASAWDEPIEPVQVQGGAARGVILHRMMEELVTGEVAPLAEALRQRATLLVEQLLGGAVTDSGLDVVELAGTVVRTWSLPELAPYRDTLIVEVPVYGRLAGDVERLVAGRADAVHYDASRPKIVFDWKSDVDPNAAARADYASQLGQYLEVLGAERGGVVYMSLGRVEWVDRPR